MSAARTEMLENIRRAVAEGNRTGSTAALEPRGMVGYQGAGPDPVARFAEEFTAAGGAFHRVANASAATSLIVALLGSKRVGLLGDCKLLDALGLENAIRSAGHETTRKDFFAAAAAISGVDFLIAETGSIVLLSRPQEPRSVSLLPPLHIAVAERSQLLPDLFDLFDGRLEGERLPACVSIITGPSKTGDIELRLVTGVHGPGEIHVILIDSLES